MVVRSATKREFTAIGKVPVAIRRRWPRQGQEGPYTIHGCQDLPPLRPARTHAPGLQVTRLALHPLRCRLERLGHADRAGRTIAGDGDVEDPRQLALVLRWEALGQVRNETSTKLWGVVANERIVHVHRDPEDLVRGRRVRVEAAVDRGAHQTPRNEEGREENYPHAASLPKAVKRAA